MVLEVCNHEWPIFMCGFINEAYRIEQEKKQADDKKQKKIKKQSIEKKEDKV